MSENERKRTGQNGQIDAADVEVKVLAAKSDHPGARRYSRAYKLRILAEADRCARGEVGALLRREGLYYSTLSKWREQQTSGRLDGSAKARKAAARVEVTEMKRLRRENERLKKELAQAVAIIAVQKKVAELLETFDK